VLNKPPKSPEATAYSPTPEPILDDELWAVYWSAFDNYPESTNLLAFMELYANPAFAFGQHRLALFHPDVTSAGLERWSGALAIGRECTSDTPYRFGGRQSTVCPIAAAKSFWMGLAKHGVNWLSTWRKVRSHKSHWNPYNYSISRRRMRANFLSFT
jgi:hypothetical protein